MKRVIFLIAIVLVGCSSEPPEGTVGITENKAFKPRDFEQLVNYELGFSEPDLDVHWHKQVNGNGYRILVGTLADENSWLEAKSKALIGVGLEKRDQGFFTPLDSGYVTAVRVVSEEGGPAGILALYGADSLGIHNALRSSFLLKQLVEY
ncbi:MAG: hypothetical protein ACI9YL_000485 [Luteibaculaceae bacterium]|jgi:hypothetical protein